MITPDPGTIALIDSNIIDSVNVNNPNIAADTNIT